MDVISISSEIESKIKLLETMRVEIKKRGENKANYIAQYDKTLAINIIKLKNMQKDEMINFEGLDIKTPLPITIIEKIAKGISFNQKLNMEKADAEYKSITSNINTVSVELNALQSLFRHLDNI